MNRLLVALLAAFDAALAAAVGLVAALAPLTLLWVFGFEMAAPWTVLWPTSARIWELGHLVPLTIALPPDYLVSIGVDQDAASFTISLAPLAFAAFTAIFAARSGARAATAGHWLTGLFSGAVVFTLAAAGAALTSANDIAAVELWQAIVFPALVFFVPALIGAIVTAWQVGDDGLIDDLRDRTDAAREGWDDVPGLIVRGSGIVLAGLVGAGALLVALGFVLRGSEVIALFQSAHVDMLGATVITIGQFAYLPTLVAWGVSFLAGPGFALGAGTSVSPAGTQVGVVPGIPMLGIIPESSSPWLLLVVLVPIGLGAFAGWVARSRLVHAHPLPAPGEHEPLGARLATALGIAVVAAGGAAVLAAASSGAFGPDRLAHVGPQPGPVALAVGLEVLVGAAILLLSPRRSGEAEEDGLGFGAVAVEDERHPAAPAEYEPEEERDDSHEFAATAPLEPLDTSASADRLGRRANEVSGARAAADGDEDAPVD